MRGWRPSPQMVSVPERETQRGSLSVDIRLEETMPPLDIGVEGGGVEGGGPIFSICSGAGRTIGTIALRIVSRGEGQDCPCS